MVDSSANASMQPSFISPIKRNESGVVYKNIASSQNKSMEKAPAKKQLKIQIPPRAPRAPQSESQAQLDQERAISAKLRRQQQLSEAALARSKDQMEAIRNEMTDGFGEIARKLAALEENSEDVRRWKQIVENELQRMNTVMGNQYQNTLDQLHALQQSGLNLDVIKLHCQELMAKYVTEAAARTTESSRKELQMMKAEYMDALAETRDNATSKQEIQEMIEQIRAAHASFAETLLTVVNALGERTPGDEKEMLANPEMQRVLQELADLRVHQSAMVEQLLQRQQKQIQAEQEAQANGLRLVLSDLQKRLEEERKSSDAALADQDRNLRFGNGQLDSCITLLRTLGSKLDTLQTELRKKDMLLEPKEREPGTRITYIDEPEGENQPSHPLALVK